MSIGRKEEIVPRRFLLQRKVDVSGVSGIGTVAFGVQFGDGKVAMRWNSELASTAIYDSIDDLDNIHSHSGATVVEWIDG